ncbi:MAG: hypothetical protein NTV32_10140 [Gammaproteobacteria bacterium]|nr:hypothetical protein [Gammaproteobacteria bacterium]
MKKYTIELTKTEYISILKAVYLGAWMANAHRTNDVKDEYESAQKLMLSLAPQFDCTEYVNPDRSKDIYPSLKLEAGEPETLRADYNEATFKSELATILGTRHFAKRYSEDEIAKMSEEDHFEKLNNCIDLYTDEFEEFGISRISFPDLED